MCTTYIHTNLNLFFPLFFFQPNFSSIIEHCNLWRNFDDIQDSWQSLESIIDYYGNNQDTIVPNAGPGHWNDPDMVRTNLNLKIWKFEEEIIGNKCSYAYMLISIKIIQYLQIILWVFAMKLVPTYSKEQVFYRRDFIYLLHIT